MKIMDYSLLLGIHRLRSGDLQHPLLEEQGLPFAQHEYGGLVSRDS